MQLREEMAGPSQHHRVCLIRSKAIWRYRGYARQWADGVYTTGTFRSQRAEEFEQKLVSWTLCQRVLILADSHHKPTD
jgi:hypothetical protein